MVKGSLVNSLMEEIFLLGRTLTTHTMVLLSIVHALSFTVVPVEKLGFTANEVGKFNLQPKVL